MVRALSPPGKDDEALKYAILVRDEARDQVNKGGVAQAVKKLKKNQDIN